MKKTVKYLIPLILSVIVVLLGVFLFFFCTPNNTGLTYETVKLKATSTKVNYYPAEYKTTCKLSIKIFVEDMSEEELENLVFTVHYKMSNGEYRKGSFKVSKLVDGKNLIQDKIFEEFTSSTNGIQPSVITDVFADIDDGIENILTVKQKAYTTSGKSISYLLFSAGSVCVAVFAVLLVYELISPLKNNKARPVFVEAPTSEETRKAELEIQKLKLENEQLKLKKEMVEKENKRVVCEHCGANISIKNDICPNCKAPIKTK